MSRWTYRRLSDRSQSEERIQLGICPKQSTDHKQRRAVLTIFWWNSLSQESVQQESKNCFFVLKANGKVMDMKRVRVESLAIAKCIDKFS